MIPDQSIKEFIGEPPYVLRMGGKVIPCESLEELVEFIDSELTDLDHSRMHLAAAFTEHIRLVADISDDDCLELLYHIEQIARDR